MFIESGEMNYIALIQLDNDNIAAGCLNDNRIRIWNFTHVEVDLDTTTESPVIDKGGGFSTQTTTTSTTTTTKTMTTTMLEIILDSCNLKLINFCISMNKILIILKTN